VGVGRSITSNATSHSAPEWQRRRRAARYVFRKQDTGQIIACPGFRHSAGDLTLRHWKSIIDLPAGYLVGDPFVDIELGQTPITTMCGPRWLGFAAVRSINVRGALERIYGKGHGEILNERWCFAGESLSSVLCGILRI
jgi:hypothetical protein